MLCILHSFTLPFIIHYSCERVYSVTSVNRDQCAVSLYALKAPRG